jgi:hypothetical protein
LHAREKNIDIAQLIYNGQKIIEQNPYLLKYADETLYDHQKQLFTICKQPTPKLVLYIAPTGTGKTMSPIGLSETHRVIFVCAARHVGLALAKASISIQKKIAFAFGCNDAVDIRLHYYAAKDYTKNSKSGGIGKVDNSQGEKVEIMISDVQSYLPAMLYMLAFNPKEKIITYWDEPTITMDYAEHDLHAIIQKNWTHNLIPNMVLSSATLPQCDEINETIRDFCARFEDVGVHEILSYDCKKTIPMINREGFVEMPHYLYTDYADIVAVTEHCKKNKTLLRYIDLGEAIRFIKYIHAGASGAGASGAGASGAGASGAGASGAGASGAGASGAGASASVAGASASVAGASASTLILNPRYTIQNHFTDLGTITMANIKLFYLDLLGNLRPENWPRISAELNRTRPLRQPSNINITTTDAHTLTDGPTIFLADDVTKIAQFYIQQANIPDYVTKEIMSKINRNQAINEELSVCEKDMEDGTTESGKDKVQREDKMSVKMKELKQKIKELQAGIQTVILNPLYVPNTHDHLYKYASKIQAQQTQAQAFTCDIAEDVVEKIMCITDVDDYWKLLLLMGIGVFAQHKSVRYTEVMKRLAQDHKLFMIIASSDYIYGTNYQFCHGYIGKDLGAMSQEKCIQAMGRVGRNKLQQDYTIRFRDNTLIYKLFQREENKPEVANMNRLFNSDV